MKNLINFINQRRGTLGLTLSAVQRGIGMAHVQQMASIMSGRAPFPPRYLRKLAKILQADLNDIFRLYMTDISIREWREVTGNKK